MCEEDTGALQESRHLVCLHVYTIGLLGFCIVARNAWFVGRSVSDVSSRVVGRQAKLFWVDTELVLGGCCGASFDKASSWGGCMFGFPVYRRCWLLRMKGVSSHAVSCQQRQILIVSNHRVLDTGAVPY